MQRHGIRARAQVHSTFAGLERSANICVCVCVCDIRKLVFFTCAHMREHIDRLQPFDRVKTLQTACEMRGLKLSKTQLHFVRIPECF